MSAPEYIKREYENGNLVKYIRHDLYQQLAQQSLNWAKIAGQNQAQINKLADKIEQLEQERDGFKNGQMQMQDINFGLMDSIEKYAKERDALKTRHERFKMAEAATQAEVERLRQRIAELEAALEKIEARTTPLIPPHFT
jgi:chromosome segregation ATPase